MMIRSLGFNLYLSLVAILLWGCQSPESKQKHIASTVRVHIEVNADGTDHSKKVLVFRERPVSINIDKDAFLTESDVSEAKVIDDMGGFAIQIKFCHKGRVLLEQYTAANRGKHLAIFSQFQPDAKTNTFDARWLAAPKVSKRVGDGILTFTPDATKAEADQIVLGLNNMAKKAENYQQ